MNTRLLAIMFTGLVIVVAMIFEVLSVAHDDQNRGLRIEKADAARAIRIEHADAVQACRTGLAIRIPLSKYIDSEVILVEKAKEAHIQLAPPPLAKIQNESFHNLKTLRDALKAATAKGCSQ